MRVRPARSAELRERGVEVTRDQVEVTVFGKTIGIIKIEETDIVIQWAEENISESVLAELMEVYVGLVEQSEVAGVFA
jgi:hypothetical protein